MFSKEITSRGALAPLTGCKLKSLHILKGELSNNFYFLQSDLPHCPAEPPCLTLVQHKSEAQQSARVSEVHMTGHTSIHHIRGALSSPRLPTPTKWVHTWQGKEHTCVRNIAKARQGECNCDSWSRETTYQPSYSCKTWVFICRKQWPCHLSTASVFLNVLQKGACLMSRNNGDTAVLIWLGSSSASQLDLQTELP